MNAERVENPILLVEDNEKDEALTLMAFEENAITNEIIVARDGEEALDLLLGETPIKFPHFILLDLKLPKVDGLKVLKAIRSDSRTELLPVIIMTSSKEDEDLISSYRYGANAYIRKPISFNDLTQVIKALGLFWLVVNEVPVPPFPATPE